MSASSHIANVPTVSYRIVDDRSLNLPAGVHSEQSRSYGYNDFSDFDRPDYYIRHIEPIESELAKQVEYDMDEQDQEWLDSINAERRKDQSGPISYEAFEIIMDKLEKEWFDLIKRVPQPASHMPVEDSMCAICDDGEGENSNAIVFCDGCNLAVHQDCYGVPYIPEGQWLCRKCTVSPENPVSCLFCPNEGGAFKQTSTGHWAHLLCAIWIPEVGVGNTVYMEPVEGVSDVPKSRWKLVCSLCKTRKGACIQCDNRSCFTAFHVSCARQEGLLMSMKSMGTDGVLRAFCERHLPPDAPRKKHDDVDSDGGPVATTTKSARAHTKSYRPGPPLVPAIIVNKLAEYVAKMAVRKKMPFIERLCRYWSLKREARRGAPLLKRLHLEPWTASNAQKEESEEDRARKHAFLARLRNDLEKIRMLAELVRKREREKLRQAQCIKDLVDDFVFPHVTKLHLVLEKISAMDRTELFLNPVLRSEVPDYFDVIKEPMCWLYIDEKLEKRSYRNTADFKRDVLLVLDNAMKYNAVDSLFHRTAARIKKNAEPLLAELDSIPSQTLDNDVGNLEPLPETLNLLLAPTDDPERDTLASLFAFTLEPPRPPTPPPEKKPKKARESNASRKEKWAAKIAEPRVSSRATRATEASLKAFEDDGALAVDSSEQAESSKMAERFADLGRRRSTRRGKTDSEPTDGPSAASSVVGQFRPVRDKRGVVGVQTLAYLTDNERREMERNMELTVEQVNGEDLFKRFNVGWVLPAGSKRGGRSERSEAAQTKLKRSGHRAADGDEAKVSASTKRPRPSRSNRNKSSRSDSSLSPITSEVEDASSVPRPDHSSLTPTPTVQGSLPFEDDTAAAPQVDKKTAANGSGDMGVDAAAPVPSPSLKRSRSQKSEASTAALQPAKKRKSRSSQAAVQHPERDRQATPKAGPSHRDAVKSSAKSGRKSTAKAVAEPDPYPAGTLVWAKVESFPFFPAEIIDLVNDRDEVPDSVLDLEESAQKGGKAWLVRFFDAQASYGWITEESLDLLGEDNAIDEGYLVGRVKSGSKKGFKKPHIKALVRKAYRNALAQMEIGEEAEDEEKQERAQVGQDQSDSAGEITVDET